MKKEHKQNDELVQVVGLLYKRGYPKSLISTVIGKSYDCVNRLLAAANCGYRWNKQNSNEFKPFPINTLIKKVAEANARADYYKSHTVAIQFNRAAFDKQKQTALSKLRAGKSL